MCLCMCVHACVCVRVCVCVFVFTKSSQKEPHMGEICDGGDGSLSLFDALWDGFDNLIYQVQ